MKRVPSFFVRHMCADHDDPSGPSVYQAVVLLGVDGGWHAVRRMARAALRAMTEQDEATDLIIGEPVDHRPYVQFHCDPGQEVFYVEMSSNHFLADPLSPSRELWLLERGWQPPAASEHGAEPVLDEHGDEVLPEGSPNFWRYAVGVDDALRAVSDLRRSHRFARDAPIGASLFECANG